MTTPVLVERSRISVANGRIVDVVVAGPHGGTALVFHHGTPGSAILFEPFVEPHLQA